MKLCFKEYDGEYKEVDTVTGMVERHYKDGTIYKGSDNWKVTRIVYLNNFGQVTYSISLDEFAKRLKESPLSQFYKNGKAKFRVCDLDHGTNRQWGKVYKKSEVYVK